MLLLFAIFTTEFFNCFELPPVTTTIASSSTADATSSSFGLPTSTVAHKTSQQSSLPTLPEGFDVLLA